MLFPLRGKLLVEIIPDTKRTASGLYLANNIEDVPHRGLVITLGLPYIDNKCREYQWDISVEEVVHFKRQWAIKETHIILKREDVYAVDGPRAVRDMVIIKRIYTGRIGDSTLHIPKGMGIESNYGDYYGEVVSVGCDDKLGVKVGDRLCYHRNEGLSVRLEDREEYWSLKPRAILAKICEV